MGTSSSGGDIAVTADLRARQITTGTEVTATTDRGSRAVGDDLAESYGRRNAVSPQLVIWVGR